MKKGIQLLVLGVLYLLLCSKSCNSREEELRTNELAVVQETRDSLLRVNDSLAPGKVDDGMFANQAKMYLQDFISYLNIVTEEHNPLDFRKKAAQLGATLFLDTSRYMIFRNPVKSSEIRISMNTLTGNFREIPSGTGFILPDSVYPLKPLIRISDTLFSGTMGFSENPKIEHESPLFRLSGKEFRYYAVKREKTFGKEKIMAWTVLLGGN